MDTNKCINCWPRSILTIQHMLFHSECPKTFWCRSVNVQSFECWTVRRNFVLSWRCTVLSLLSLSCRLGTYKLGTYNHVCWNKSWSRAPSTQRASDLVLWTAAKWKKEDDMKRRRCCQYMTRWMSTYNASQGIESEAGARGWNQKKESPVQGFVICCSYIRPDTIRMAAFVSCINEQST